MEHITYKFQDICETITDYVANGSFKSLADNVQYSDAKDYARLIRLVDFNNNYDEKNAIWVPESSYNFLKKTVLYGDEVIISNVGANLGTVFKCPKLDYPMTLGPNSILVKTNSLCNQNYLYYYLKSNVGYSKLMALVSGSAMPKFNKTELRNMEISLPDRVYQDKAVELLIEVDKKIELNNKINNNLYELLRNEYNEKFVNQKSDSWIQDKLGNYLSVDRGLSYKGNYLSEDGVAMINLGNVMPNGVFRIEKNKYYSGDFKDKVTAKVGDIVMANTDMTQNREVIGTPVIIPPIYDDKIIFSHHIYCLRNLKLPKMYVFYSLLTDEWNGVAGGNATGTTVLALPKETIENYNITIPDNNTLELFDKLANTIQSRRNQIMLENIKLSELRDTLLPKLMNGEINLDNIEI